MNGYVWADGQNWPADGELDVFEGVSGAACWHFHDPQGGPGNCAAGTFTGGWHTFAADWEPGIVTSYYDYDGRAVGTIARASPVSRCTSSSTTRRATAARS